MVSQFFKTTKIKYSRSWHYFGKLTRRKKTSFLIWIPFISFSSLIAIARTSRTMLNNSGESGYPCLVPDLRGNAFHFSPLRIMFAVGLSYMAFTMLSCSFYAHFLNCFNHKWVPNFVKGFSCIYCDDHMVLIFQFVNTVYHIDWFVYIEESLHSWNKPNLIMVYELFDVLLISAKIFLRIFASMFISDISL